MLLEQTLQRIALMISLDRTVAIVVLAHERFYTSVLADLLSRWMAIQPENQDPPCLYGLFRLTTMVLVSCKGGSYVYVVRKCRVSLRFCSSR